MVGRWCSVKESRVWKMKIDSSPGMGEIGSTGLLPRSRPIRPSSYVEVGTIGTSFPKKWRGSAGCEELPSYCWADIFTRMVS
ncbi:hypothetical protein AVEN_103977-1 [Araneus ventricosus]|uniref:Uncharacterized protein n=1 Tax=Araneus ventricosus TaxID=182803 RepID=A0A4Y2QPJ2_ARAVE|nr:hypothetical protein AVEN_103977-1 [Araneus ventricosus]